MNLINSHLRRSIFFAYSLTVIETIIKIFIPFLIGLAIDEALKHEFYPLLILMFWWVLYICIVVIRGVYDTRIFTAVFNHIVEVVVSCQINEKVSREKIASRVVLARDVIGFLEQDFPLIIIGIISALGSVAMVFFLDKIVGGIIICAVLPLLFLAKRFAKKSVRLNSALNNKLENESKTIIYGNGIALRMYLKNARRWRIYLSNSQAVAWGCSDMVTMFVTIAVIYRTGISEGLGFGQAYALLNYVWDFQNTISGLPNAIQRIAKVRDILARIS